MKKHDNAIKKTKKCNRCKQEKSINEFTINKKYKDNLNYYCTKCVSLYNKQYILKNKEKYKKYQTKNSDKIKQYNKQYNLLNKEKIKQYNLLNREKIVKQTNHSSKIRKKNDPLFRLSSTLRTRIWDVFKKQKHIKNIKTEQLLGASFDFVKQHIENKFQEGMNWENYGKWHVDHIIPLASAKDEKELKKLFHYTNLQPLWALDNLLKGKNIL